MKKPGYPALLAVLVGLSLASAGQAAEWLLSVDPEASEIRFTLGATLHSVRGSVALERGEIELDPGGSQLTGEIVADALSATTGHPGRDRDMHSKVLESDRFPRFVLRPRRLEGELRLAGTSRVRIHGDLSIHGGTHAVVVPAEVRIEDERLTASGHLTVPYVEWGMRNPSKLLLRVKKFVEVEVVLICTLGSGEP